MKTCSAIKWHQSNSSWMNLHEIQQIPLDAKSAYSKWLDRGQHRFDVLKLTDKTKLGRRLMSAIALSWGDLPAAPVSQAFVERIFSVCGLMTTGRRNRMCKSLEMRAFLKLNRNVCWTGVTMTFTHFHVFRCCVTCVATGRTKCIGIKIWIEAEIVAWDGIKYWNRNYSQRMESELK